MSEKEVFNYLLEAGCCKLCCLRYLFVRNPETITNSDLYILKKEYLPDANEEQVKKLKPNPCVVCLGLLQNVCVDEIVDKIAGSELVQSYDSKVFTCSVSFPASIQIREHSIRLYIERKFPDYFINDAMETQLNKVWKWLIKNKLAEKLNRTFESSETCAFSINVLMKYEQDEEELATLLKMQPNLFSLRKTQHKKYHGEVFSRKGVLSALEQTKAGIFTEYASVPPTIATNRLQCHNIDCNHDSIYLAGRYCKFSRELSQTPWILNGVRQMESSVQDILFEGIQKTLSIPLNGLVFSASGREDVDVRCLGRGRPFYIEILDPKKTQYTFRELRDAEKEVNSSEFVNIKDLQLVPRSELVHVKAGEETKTKEYVALCTSTGVTEETVRKINEHGPLVLRQKTPLRVMHRRPLAVRPKTIHSMSARAVREDLFVLRLETQAGTYVKEFVHGDLGRTAPSVGTIVGGDVDILALDVISVNLDWPQRVDYTLE